MRYMISNVLIAAASIVAVPLYAAPQSQVMQGELAHAYGLMDQAVNLIRPLAERGDALAQFWMGHFFEKGEGVQQDDTAAVEWYRKAAEQGVRRAQIELARHYRFGRGVAKDSASAIHWYSLAAADPRSEGEQNAESKPESKLQVSPSLQGNLIDARLELGLMLSSETNAPDYPKALSLIEYAKQQGSPFAYIALADMKKKGRGTDIDLKGSRHLYEVAAYLIQDSGFSQWIAQRNLADMLENGNGGDVDIAEAFRIHYIDCSSGNDKECENARSISSRLTPQMLAIIDANLSHDCEEPFSEYNKARCGTVEKFRSEFGYRFKNYESAMPIARYNVRENESRQKSDFIKSLSGHFTRANLDPRFVIDRTSGGMFKFANKVVQVVVIPTDTIKNKNSLYGSGTIISNCFILTAAHVANVNMYYPKEKIQYRKEILIAFGDHDDTDIEEVSYFRYMIGGKVFEKTFLRKDHDVTSDISLIRFNKKMSFSDFPKLGVPSGTDFSIESPYGSADNFIINAGYPGSKTVFSPNGQGQRVNLWGDICNKAEMFSNSFLTDEWFLSIDLKGEFSGVDRSKELFSSTCLTTEGQSGGPVFYYKTKADGSFDVSLISVNSSGDNVDIASRSTGTRSWGPLLTPEVVAAIQAIINRPTDENCMPADGKPW